MSPQNRWVAGLLTGLALVVFCIGCGGLGVGTLERLLPPGTFGSGSSSPYLGKFTLTKIDSNNVSQACPGTLNTGGATYTCEGEVRTFLTGGTFIESAPVDLAGSGTYATTGSSLTVTLNGVTTTGNVGFAADLSYFVYTVNNVNYTWTRG